MDKYECIACGYIYDPELGDPEAGIAPGTPFEDLPMIGNARTVVLAKTNSKKIS